MEAVKVREQERIYRYPDGNRVRLVNVVELKVSESGNHRITLEDGTLYIIAPGWLCIIIKSEDGWVA